MSIFNNEWHKANEYRFNVEYIEKLLNKFNITTYNAVANGYGGDDLCIQLALYKYKVEMDYSNCCVNIKRGKRVFLSQKNSREYMPIKHTVKQDKVWYDTIKWISKNSKEI